jgi:serine/threonine protein kinase/Tfp pilus assembly protein PilF
MSYCINPSCPKPTDFSNLSTSTCPHCGSRLLLQNRYRVRQQLGEGGFGKTYLVEDTLSASAGKSGTRKVLKVLVKNIPIAVKLFQREAKVLSKLQHPGIPRVDGGCFKFRAGLSVEPLHCLVMEFIDGSDLNSWLKSRGNPPRPIAQEQAIAWLHQLVDILSELHNNSVQQYFHRDIKPANIMLRPNGQLVLIDFGAVREVTPTLLVKVGAGQPLTGICSPGYAPPEQIEGRPLPQSDFFALGRTMVHLLTGKHPLNLAVDVHQGTLLWRKHAPTVTEPLADLIDDLMATLPGKRPLNTETIKQRLEAIDREGNRGLARQGTGGSTAKSSLTPVPNPQVSLPSLEAFLETAIPKMEPYFGKRTREIVVASGVALVALLGFLGFRWGTSQMAIAYNERGVTHHLANQLYLAQVDFERALTLKPDYVEARFHLGENYETLGDVKQARKAYEMAVRGKLPEAYSNLARLDILEGNYNKAVSLLEEGLKLTQKTTVRYALLKNLGWAYLNQNRHDRAKAYLQKAIHLNREKASAYCLLALTVEATGEPTNALIAWQSCRRYASRTHRDEKKWLQEADKRLTAVGKGG